MQSVIFSVPFVFGKQRPRVLRSGRAYTPSKTAECERDIQIAWKAACNGYYIAKPHPVIVTINAYELLPKSKPNRITREPFVTKPDADNMAKLVMDALNHVAWDDDSQVTHLHVIKHARTRASDPCMDVSVCW